MGEMDDHPSQEEYDRLRAENERLLESLRDAYDRRQEEKWKEQRFRRSVKEAVVVVLVLVLIALAVFYLGPDDRIPEERCQTSLGLC